jgi:hypothetical protein
MEGLGFGKFTDQGEAKEVVPIESKAAEEKTKKREKIIVEVEQDFLKKIAQTNSNATIGEKGTISTPFDFEGKKFIATGSTSKGGIYSRVSAYEVIPESEYKGESMTWIEHRLLPGDHPDRFSYNRIRVKFKKDSFVLSGPEIEFVPKKENLSATTVKVPANISRVEMAELWLINGYFHSLEIEEAKKSVDPVEFLRKTGVEARRGTGGTIEGKTVHCFTRSGGKVEVFLAPDDSIKDDPTFVMTLKNLAKKVVENFPKDQSAVTTEDLDIIPGDIVKTSWNTGPYKVVRVSQNGSLVVVLPDAKPFKNGGYKESDYFYINDVSKSGDRYISGNEEIFVTKTAESASIETDEQLSANFDEIVPEEQPALPPIDLELYEREQIGNGGEIDDETDLTPEQTRAEYFADALREVDIIRQTEDLLATDLKPKDRKKNQEQLDRRLSGLSGYLVGAHNYFGKPSAEHLRMLLEENCFYFDDEYRLTATSTEQLQRRTALEEKGWRFAQSSDGNFNGYRHLPDREQPVRFSAYSSLDEILTVAEDVENSSILPSPETDKAALEAKYHQLIKEVLIGEEQFNFIVRELEDDYGVDWAQYCKETFSDGEFQEDVKDIWLESGGDPKIFTEKFRPSAEETVPTEPDDNSLPTTVMQECKFELTDSEIVKRSASMTNAMNELDAEINRFKAEKDKHNANLKMINARIQKHRTAIDTRTEWREIECVLDYDFQRGTVDIIRPDSGERVRQRTMSKEEMSKALFKK